MKTLKLLQASLITLLWMLGIACVSQEASNSNVTHNTFTVKLDKLTPETSDSPTKIKIQEVNNLDNQPKIFHYISNSDYVVIAVLDKKDYVGKVNKQEKLDLRNEVAGFVYSFRVEKTLCSKESLSPKAEPQTNPLQDFQIFVRAGTQGENYGEGQRYLIFLRQMPKEEKLSSIYELDGDKIFFRPFGGDKSIFPSEGVDFHEPTTRGVIEMSSVKHQDLIRRIETLCSALSGEDKNTKINNLRNLIKSDDKELKDNAIYTIKILQN